MRMPSVFKIRRRTRNGVRSFFRGQVLIGHYPSGLPKYRTFQAATKQDCWALITEFQKNLGDDLDPLKPQTCGQLFDLWLKTYCARELKPSTFDCYASHLRLYLGEFRNVRLDELDKHRIHSWLDAQFADGRRSDTSIRLTARVLKVALQFALEREFIRANPMPRTKRRQPDFEGTTLSASDAERFICCAQEDPYLGLICWLAIKTGMRSGELRALCASDLAFREGSNRCEIRIVKSSVHVRGRGEVTSHPKTKSSRRTLELCGDIARALAAYTADNPSGLLFAMKEGKPLSAARLSQMFGLFLKNHDLPRIRFHDLRHSYASLALASGTSILEVSRSLGHAKPSITLDIYGHFIPTKAARLFVAQKESA